MKVLVTGASGRIGRVLVHGLPSSGFELRPTDRTNANPDPVADLVVADLADPATCRDLVRGVDAVVHLAGHPNTDDWDEAMRINVEMARQVFSAAADTGVRSIVYASSIHVAGMHPVGTRFDSETAIAPDGAYGSSKAMAEDVLRCIAAIYGISCVALRIGSFRPAPTNVRELSTWLSHDDCVAVVAAALQVSQPGFTPIWAFSDNSRAPVDREMWRQVGYRPQDDAEDHVGALVADGIDTDGAGECPLLGGEFAERTLANVEARRTKAEGPATRV